MKDYESKAGDNKESYNNEKKLADEVEAELLSRQRKVNIKFFLSTNYFIALNQDLSAGGKKGCS